MPGMCKGGSVSRPFLCRHVGQEAVDRGAQLGGLPRQVARGIEHHVGRAVGGLARRRRARDAPRDAGGAVGGLTDVLVISAAAAFCWFTAEAIVAVKLSISPITAVMAPTLSTARLVADCTSAIWEEISSVAFAVWVASAFTSEATTAKPRPASPARAASMVALRASRLVCPAMVRMKPTTSSMCWAAVASVPMVSLASSAMRRSAPHDVGGFVQLAFDGLHGIAELPRGGRDGLHVGGGLVRARCRLGGLLPGLLGDRRQGSRGLGQFTRSSRPYLKARR